MELKEPLLSPAKPLEFNTYVKSEEYKPEHRLSSENVVSQNEVIDCLPFLLSRFGLDHHLLEKLENIQQNSIDRNSQNEPLLQIKKGLVSCNTHLSKNQLSNYMSDVGSEESNSNNSDGFRYFLFKNMIIILKNLTP